MLQISDDDSGSAKRLFGAFVLKALDPALERQFPGSRARFSLAT